MSSATSSSARFGSASRLVRDPARGSFTTRTIPASRSSLPPRAASCIAKHWPKARTRPFRPNGWGATCPPIIRPGSGRRRDGELFMKRHPVQTTVVAATLLGAATLPAAAADVADFYRGKRINFVIGYGTGGGYDIYARLFARFIGEPHPRQSHGRAPEHAGRRQPARGELALRDRPKGRHRYRVSRPGDADRPGARPARHSVRRTQIQLDWQSRGG